MLEQQMVKMFVSAERKTYLRIEKIPMPKRNSEHVGYNFNPFTETIVTRSDIQLRQINNSFEIIEPIPWRGFGEVSIVHWLKTWGNQSPKYLHNPPKSKKIKQNTLTTLRIEESCHVKRLRKDR